MFQMGKLCFLIKFFTLISDKWVNCTVWELYLNKVIKIKTKTKLN